MCMATSSPYLEKHYTVSIYITSIVNRVSILKTKSSTAAVVKTMHTNAEWFNSVKSQSNIDSNQDIRLNYKRFEIYFYVSYVTLMECTPAKNIYIYLFLFYYGDWRHSFVI